MDFVYVGHKEGMVFALWFSLAGFVCSLTKHPFNLYVPSDQPFYFPRSEAGMLNEDKENRQPFWYYILQFLTTYKRSLD